MDDTDYKQNGATSIISMLGSIVAALGFEITDNAKAAVTMLKMQKEILENASLKDFLTGNVALKTIQNVSTGVWYVPGKLIHFIQKYLATVGGGYPSGGGDVNFGRDLVKVPVNDTGTYITMLSSEATELTPWEAFTMFVKKMFGVTPTWTSNGDEFDMSEDLSLYYVEDGQDSWLFKKNVLFAIVIYNTQSPPSSYRERRKNVSIFLLAPPSAESYSSVLKEKTATEKNITRTYRLLGHAFRWGGIEYDGIYNRNGTEIINDYGSNNVVTTNADVNKESNYIDYDFGVAYKAIYNNVNLTDEAHFYLSTDAHRMFIPGGGITRGGGVGRHHSLPQDENFPPCGGDTTVPQITQWTNRVINWNGECYMPLTYFKVNPSNENPGTEPGSPNTPIDPDDPTVDPTSIIVYTYPNDTPQDTPQSGDNTVQTSGQLMDNYTNATNGPSDIPNTDIKGGLYTLWHPSAGNLQKLGAFLYGGTTQGTIASIIGDPINAIIQLTEWAVTPVDGPSKSPVICNIAATELKMPTIPNQFMQFDCGTIEIPREYSDFRDYEPYTRLSLFLPFVGDVNISTNDCITPHKIHVIYNIDFLSGAACAEVLVDEDVRYAYQAAMCAAIPVTSSDASRLLASLIGAAVGAIGGGAMGGIVGGTAGSRMAASSLIGGVSEAALSPVNGIQIQRTGSISANTGLLGEMKPYVLVTRPISVVADQYKSLLGHPYQLDGTLGSQKGFVKVREVHLDGITATEAEKTEIEQILKEGVIL